MRMRKKRKPAAGRAISSCYRAPSEANVQMKVDVAVPGIDILGECPLWDERSRMLWWVDSRGPAIKCLAPGSSAVAIRSLPEAVGSIAFCESGRMLAATKSGIHFFDPAGGGLERIANPEAHLPDNRFN